MDAKSILTELNRPVGRNLCIGRTRKGILRNAIIRGKKPHDKIPTVRLRFYRDASQIEFLEEIEIRIGSFDIGFFPKHDYKVFMLLTSGKQ